ncbi:MAG: sugar ABC transporter permease [Oscillospiraceae bacterium]|nr:sugar ABC transporter permease [Oscillospiraceae bacterium]
MSTFHYSFTDKLTFSNATDAEVNFVGIENFYKNEEFKIEITPVEGDESLVIISGSSKPREIMICEDTGNEYVMQSFDEKKYYIHRDDNGDMYAMANMESGVFGTELLRKSFINTPLLWLMGFIPQIALALLLAALFTDIRTRVRGQGLFKVLFYMPNIMTAATIAALFIAMVSNGGIIHQIAVQTGYVENATMPITGVWFTRSVIAFINFWLWFGNTMVVLIAAMISVDKSRIEAATIDGANRGQIFAKITIPSIRPVLLFTLIQSLVGGLQMFDIPQLMSSGVGGGLNPDATRTIMTSIQQIAFGTSQNIGLSSAIAVVLFLMTAVLSLVVYLMMQSSSDRRENRMQRQFKKDEDNRIKMRKLGVTHYDT